MTQHEPAHALSDADAPSRRGRRALIAGAATAAVGALGVAIAKPADAAAGSPLVLGRSNSSGGSTTTVSSTNTTAAVDVKSTAGTGLIGETTKNTKWGVHGRNTAATSGTTGAVRGEGRQNHGVRGDTANPNRHGVLAVNAATVTGLGTAVRAGGRQNVGLWADADNDVVPAIYADGNNGTGVSMLANGFVDVESGLFALNAQVGIVSGPLVGGIITEAFVASGSSAFHVHTDTATLAVTDTEITVPVAFSDAADVSLATIMFTGLGASAGNVYIVSKTPTSFVVGGGTADQQVDYVIIAPRLDVFSVSLNKAGQKTKLVHKHGIHVPSA